MSALSAAVSTVDSWANGEFDLGDVTGPISVGSGMLSAALDPVGALIAAPLGELLAFMVRQIGPVQDALDKLMGSDAMVAEQAAQWTAVATAYANTANDHAAGVTDTPSWTGAAADTYRDIMSATNDIFHQVSGAASKMSAGVTAMGSLVAMVRDYIWEVVSMLLAQAIQAAIAALAAAVPSFGASLATFAGWYTTRVASTCLKISQWIEGLLKRAREVFKRFTGLRKLIEKAIKEVRQFSQAMKRMQRYAGRPMSVDASLPKSRRDHEVPRGMMPGDVAGPNRKYQDPTTRIPFGDPTPSSVKDIPGQALPDRMDVAKTGIEAGSDIYQGHQQVPDIVQI